MDLMARLLDALWSTALDVLPIVAIVFVFQFVVLRRRPPHLGRVLVGFVYVLIGLAMFMIGLQEALFPLGKTMAHQLTAGVGPAADAVAAGLAGALEAVRWQDYLWVYAFAAAIGFATTIAEPSLIAVAIKARSVSGGTVSVWGLRIAVALGVAVGVALGTVRIVTGTPLHLYIIAGYAIVIIQTVFAPKTIIPLAYDSGGVTSSTVTVPLVTALGLGLASAIPGRSPLLDGFGLIAFACLFAIIAVLGYAQIGAALHRRPRNLKESEDSHNEV